MCVTKTGVLLLLALFASIALGVASPTYQEERRIYGKVTDETGAAVPNVYVILEYARSGVIGEERWTEMSRAITSETGEYKFSTRGSGKTELPIGDYRLTFKHSRLRQVSRTTSINFSASGAVGAPEFVREVNVQLRSGPLGGGATVLRPPSSPPPPENQGGPPDTPVDVPAATPPPSATPAPEGRATPMPSSSNANVSANTNRSANANRPANANRSANTNTSANANTGAPPAAPPTSSEIDQILKGLDLGNIAFNTPESMSLKDAKKVELLLSTSLSDDALKEAVAKQNVEGEIQVEQIKISDQMEANLTGDGFQITDVLPARRAISKTGTTEWKWDVRPLKEGKLRLHLTLNALVTIGGNSQLYPIRTFDREYVVAVGMTDTVVNFAKDNWKWLWTTIVFPVGAWLWKRKRASSAAAAV